MHIKSDVAGVGPGAHSSAADLVRGAGEAVVAQLAEARPMASAVGPVVAEGFPGFGSPEPRDHRELLLEAVEALTERREGDAVCRVLGLEPARAESQLDSS